MAFWVSCARVLVGSVLCAAAPVHAQGTAQAPSAALPATPGDAPLPAVPELLREVEQHQRMLEKLERDYTYHVHTVQQELNAQGAVSKTETVDAESVNVDGIRVDRVVARNGKPLTGDEARKESERVDKAIASARERRSKLQSKGAETDAQGNAILPLSRILELGTFSHPRRVMRGGRATIAMDYTGDPQAKTRNAFEGVMRSVDGTLWIDETDRVLAAADGEFRSDFKLGGGLLADIQKGSRFQFQATRVGDGVWLPASIDGQGSARVLLFAHFRGRLHAVTSDYRRYRASATIVNQGSPAHPGAATDPSASPQIGPADPASQGQPTVVSPPQPH